MDASKVITDRAYKVIRDFPVEVAHKPEVGDTVYCYEAGRTLSLAFSRTDQAGQETNYRLSIPRRDADGCLVFAKFIALPASLKRRFNIREDGTRIRFTKGQVYRLAAQVDGSAPAGTLFRCIKGGSQPMMISWPDNAAQPVAADTSGHERQQLYPATDDQRDTTLDEFSMTTGSAAVDWNWVSWRIRLDSETLSWRNYSLVLSRTNGPMRVVEHVAGSLVAMVKELRSHLNHYGVMLTVSDNVLIELYANHQYHFQGLRPFASTVMLIKQYIEQDNEQVERNLAGRKAATASLPIGGSGGRTRKKMSGKAYRSMLTSNAAKRLAHGW